MKNTPETALPGAEPSKVLVIRIPNVKLSADEVRGLFDGGARAEADWPDPGIHFCHGADIPETYVYQQGLTQEHLAMLERVKNAVTKQHPDADVAVMDVMQTVDGASAGKTARWHYVVETDVQPDAEQDFNDWYSQEHLPGLASVPGTVQAVRLHNPQGSPRYHAFYMLESRETFGSEPWLAVRATDWSSRVRPSFMNTKRTMFTIQTP